MNKYSLIVISVFIFLFCLVLSVDWNYQSVPFQWKEALNSDLELKNWHYVMLIFAIGCVGND